MTSAELIKDYHTPGGEGLWFHGTGTYGSLHDIGFHQALFSHSMQRYSTSLHKGEEYATKRFHESLFVEHETNHRDRAISLTTDFGCALGYGAKVPATGIVLGFEVSRPTLERTAQYIREVIHPDTRGHLTADDLDFITFIQTQLSFDPDQDYTTEMIDRSEYANPPPPGVRDARLVEVHYSEALSLEHVRYTLGRAAADASFLPFRSRLIPLDRTIQIGRSVPREALEIEGVGINVEAYTTPFEASDEPLISRHHCVIVPEGVIGDTPHIADLGSTNGTQLRSRWLEPFTWRPLDERMWMSIAGKKKYRLRRTENGFFLEAHV